ncbi:MAG: RelA/SpoT family protein [Candidatus Berkelbacteria bacterium]
MEFKDLEAKLNYLSAADRKIIRRAFDYASEAHANQKRNSGEPFVCHELETAAFIADLRLDYEAISAALLHDVCEDTVCTQSDIKKIFGVKISELVDGVTKLGHIRIVRKWLFITDEHKLKDFERQVENLRKMFVAMAKDIRVILIKLADRLHNMKTLDGVDPKKRYRIARETLEIYAPLAYRLGMGELKGQLEDLAFPYVYPNEYKSLTHLVVHPRTEKEKYLEKLKFRLLKRLAKAGIRAEINGRAKHWYSLWRKLERQHNDLSQIYDLVALRIEVENIEQCYRVLGIIHEVYKPLVGRIKDYIAQPKPNGYQSLHTTVFADGGQIVEIQIRTHEMHDRAENGIAAHWHYSERKNALNNFFSPSGYVPYQDLVWVRELSKWQKSTTDHSEIVQDLSTDFFSNRIFVYTPQGDVYNLPTEATPIDFAYAIHTDLGNTAVGAKVNGKIIEISHALQNGDIVEILTKKNSKPKQDWLTFVKTTSAKSKIRAALKLK